MNGYVCFYRDKRLEVYADTLWNAKEKAIQEFKLEGKKSRFEVSVHLAELQGKPVVHVADI